MHSSILSKGGQRKSSTRDEFDIPFSKREDKRKDSASDALFPEEVSKSRVDFTLDFVQSLDPYTSGGHSSSGESELHEYVYQDQINFLPIVYSPSYDIDLFGIEKVHPFDTKKWSKIAASLSEFLLNNGGSRYEIKYLQPKRCITRRELTIVHSDSFVNRMHHNKRTIASAAESFFLLLIPMAVIRARLVKPIKWQVSGSILASKVAMDQGWAINLGGGFHHCSHNSAGGFCLFADITLVIKFLWRHVSRELRFMIIDLDAHQGNGHERDVLSMAKEQQKQIYIMDVFNPLIFPHDVDARPAINRLIEVPTRTRGEKYLQLVEHHVTEAFSDFPDPDLVIYNAGTDILKGDPLGRLAVEFDDVVRRDEIIFSQTIGVHKRKILMLTSGGYSSKSATVVSASIQNLFNKKLII
jgi:histone deacetylase 11